MIFAPVVCGSRAAFASLPIGQSAFIDFEKFPAFNRRHLSDRACASIYCLAYMGGIGRIPRCLP